MNRDNIVNVCKMLGWEYRDHASDEWVMTQCPFAVDTHEGGVDTNPSFGITVRPGENSNYHCLACGKKGRLLTLPNTLEHLKVWDAETTSEMREVLGRLESFGERQDDSLPVIVIPPEIPEEDWNRFGRVTHRMIAARGIAERTALQFDLRLDTRLRRMLIPIYYEQGYLVSARGRFLADPDYFRVPKYREYVDLAPAGKGAKHYGIWYGEHLPRDTSKAIILVEGEIDLIKVVQTLPSANVLASMGATISTEQLMRLPPSEKGYILFFDNDTAGHRAAHKIINHLPDAPLYRVTKYFGCKDPDEIVNRELLIPALKSVEKVRIKDM